MLIAQIVDGAYTVSGLAFGEAKVTVETFEPRKQVQVHNAPVITEGFVYGGADGEFEVGKYVAIPIKYADPDTSGLSAMVDSQQKTIDFDLED